MAVGPFELVASCVTGGTGVAKDRDCTALFCCHDGVEGKPVSLDMDDAEALFVSWLIGFRSAIIIICNED